MRKKLRFNIGGAFTKAEQLMMFFFKNKEVLQTYDFTVFDGINNCSWNGGRVNRDVHWTDTVVDFYRRNNISVALTFTGAADYTNQTIDLDDKVGNELLEKFHTDNPRNYIISANTELAKYVSKNFPNYKNTRSITSFYPINVPMKDEDFDRYRNLEDIYDIIVPRMEHVHDEKFTKLNVPMYEVLINDTCVYNCPYYGEHFKVVADQNSLYEKPWAEAGHDEMYNIEECWLSDRSTYLESSAFDPDVGHQGTIDKWGENYGMDLTLCQIKKLIKLGVYNFKMSGREMNYEDFEGELNSFLRLYEGLG